MVSNHVKDLIERYGTDGSVVPKALTDYVEARKFYDYADHSRVGAAHGEFVTRRDLRPLLRPRQRRAGDGQAARARVDRGRPLLDLPDDPRAGGDARRLRQRRDPAVRRSAAHRRRQPQSEAAAWDEVAGGWERRRDAALGGDAERLGAPRRARSTHGRARRSSSSPRAPERHRVPRAPGGSGRAGDVLSTDVAPEMVEAARRRAAELGVGECRLRGRSTRSGSIFRTLGGRRALPLRPDADPRSGARRSPRSHACCARPAGPRSPCGPTPTATTGLRRPAAAALSLGLMERPDPDAPGPFRLADPVRLRALVAGAGLTLASSRRTFRSSGDIRRSRSGGRRRATSRAHSACCSTASPPKRSSGAHRSLRTARTLRRGRWHAERPGRRPVSLWRRSERQTPDCAEAIWMTWESWPRGHRRSDCASSPTAVLTLRAIVASAGR